MHVMHMHGFLDGALCATCDARWPAPLSMNKEMECPKCAAQTTRPDIVWFGEMPYQMDEIYHHLSEADIFAAIGTSGNVYPAAGFVQDANVHGAHTVELNLEPSETASQFSQTIFGKASDCVPDWVDSLL
jgi:NAD-dependent deacetylase